MQWTNPKTQAILRRARHGIVCLQETRWTASTATNFLQTYPGFNIAHSPSILTENGGLSGGVAILIPCAFRLLQEVVITPGKLLAAQVQSRTDCFWVISAYCHPNSVREDCEALARWLTDHQDHPDPFFIVGDFNHGHHLSLDAWHRILNCAQGDDIVKDEPTFWGPNGSSSIDKVILPTEYMNRGLIQHQVFYDRLFESAGHACISIQLRHRPPVSSSPDLPLHMTIPASVFQPGKDRHDTRQVWPSLQSLVRRLCLVSQPTFESLQTLLWQWWMSLPKGPRDFNTLRKHLQSDQPRNPSNQDIKLLRQRGFAITHITGWRAYLGTAQHSYSHWTRVALPEGRPDMAQLEGTPGVLPFEVYSQAPLRLISWCSFELPKTAKRLLRELADMCELPETTTQALVTHIAVHNSEVQTEQEATQYLASLATVTIASRTKLLNYTTMVQHFLGTLQLPMAVYMLDYYLPMLSPNEGYNETGLTMQSAGPIRQPWQPITFEFLFKGSEFGHWKVKGGQDAFAFRHPSLGKTEVFSLLASDAHHHKVSPIGTGRLVAMVGTADAPADDGRDLQILFGLVLAITPRTSKSKDELPASRIHRQCNPRFIEVAFLSEPAIEFFAQEQLVALQDWYVASGQRLDPIDATVQGQKGPVPGTFFLHTMWMFGCTKPTREVTAVAQTPLCRYHLGLGIYNVQTAVEGMDGNKRSHFLHLCGQLLRLVLIPCHVEGELHPWTRSTALSFAAELDGHVLGTLCAVTMALLTNRLDLCIQGLFGAGKSKSMAILILALIEINVTDSLKILFICKENSGTRSFADLLLWLDPPSGVFGRIGRLVGDQERNKSSYSHTKFDIHPRERRQMLNKCQLILATGGAVAQDLTLQWSTMGGFMQELSLLVIDEGQQYGTDREIAVISLLRQQPLVLWTGDSEQTPGGIDRAARNAKRSRQLLLAKKHGLRSDRNYYMPANLADAMIRLLDGSANEGLATLSQILKRGQHCSSRPESPI